MGDGKKGRIIPQGETNVFVSRRENGVKGRTHEGPMSYVTKGDRSHD